MVTRISPEEFRDKLDADESFQLIDTRSNTNFTEWHIKDAINFPHPEGAELKPEDVDRIQEIAKVNPEDQVIAVCAKGLTSFDFAEKLEEHGFNNVKTIAGGMEAWSGVYDRVPIATVKDDLVMVQLQRRAKGCLGYLVGSKTAGEAAVVDVSRYTQEFLDAATEEGLKITKVFDTHIHADHISGGRKLADRLGVKYFLGSEAVERNPKFNYVPVEDHEVIDVGGVSIKALHTPGHTTEMMSLLIEGEALISGDSLFANSIGRTELEFHEDARKGAKLQYKSLIDRILSLPDKVKVLPGHFAVSDAGESEGVTPGTPIFSTIGYLRNNNKALAMGEDEFVEYISQNVPEKPPNYERVIRTNRGTGEEMSKEEEIELELGPNRCATSEEDMVD